MNFQDPNLRTVLVENTVDLLAKLRDTTGITAALAIMANNGHEGVVLASLPGKMDHCYVPRTGFHFHLHCTAPGKALLAGLPRTRRLQIISEIPFETFTSHTCHNREKLEKLLEDYSRQGYSVDVGEYVEGVNCVSSCVRLNGKQPLAAIWITALSMDLPMEQMSAYAKQVIRISREMEIRLRSVTSDHVSQINLTIEQVKQFIDLHFIDSDAIHGFIRNQNMSEKWLRTWFKKRYGLSPLKYRQCLLFERARRLLINTNLCVKEIAFQLGYENQNYFSRAFKAHFGESPQNFRE